MTYVSWAAFHEGNSDGLYFGVLLPRLMESIVSEQGVRHSDIPSVPAVMLGRNGRTLDNVAAEICEARDAFQVVFIHADTGGRSLQKGLSQRSSAFCERAFELCAWPQTRCITVTPRHETEAWILADPEAVMDSLGYRGKPADIGLPIDATAAERLADPKATLEAVMKQVSGRRRRTARVEQLFPAIAQRQSIEALRASASFREFEAKLLNCLADLGCIAARPGGKEVNCCAA